MKKEYLRLDTNMANYITIPEESEMPIGRFTTVSSRYRESKIVFYTENKLISFTLYRKSIYKSSVNDKYYVITPGTEYRPDLVSYAAYGTVDFWWRIMEANKIKDVFEFKTGRNIVIPKETLR